MKKILFVSLAFALIAFMFSSCSADHSIRIKNSFSEAMSEVKINSTSYGSIAIGKTTGYKPVDEGSFTMSGSTTSGKPLTGSGSVKGNGTHKWTITITASGSCSIAEDL